jgi:hypothetical protein
MKKINMEDVQESGSFNRIKPGGYVCVLTFVEDKPDKEYLYIQYDIAEGEYKDYYKKLNEDRGFWGGRMWRSYKEKALPMFKRMCSAVAKSNPGYVFDGMQNSDESTLVGKKIGLVIGEEEYETNDGAVKNRLYVAYECSVKDIESGSFKVPDYKPMSPGSNAATTPTISSDGFMNIPDGIDEQLPF